MRTTTARTITKILATVALVGGAATVAGIGTFGAYTDTTDAGVKVTAGTVSVLMNGSDAGISVNAANIMPGGSVQFPVTVRRGPHSAKLGALDVATTTTDPSSLTTWLKLTIDSCDQPWVRNGNELTCAGTTEHVLVDGSVSQNGSSSAWPQASRWLADLNDGRSVYVRGTLALDTNAPNSTQGATADITWTVTGSQATGETAVVTPRKLS